jgi:hypothetical protein
LLNQDDVEKIRREIALGEPVLDVLRNKFMGRVALVISAGPSALGWKKIYESLVDENPIIICIKQTVEMEELNEICDIHFINPYNLKNYNYKRKPLIVYSGATDSPPVFNKYDIEYKVKKSPSASLEETVAFTGKFQDFQLDKTGVIRPWGPGIMYESVFYTLQHMGVNKIVTIGWDIADSSGGNNHYYDTSKVLKTIGSVVRVIISKVRLQRFYNNILFKLGKKYNYAGMLEGEAEVTSKSISSLTQWLNDSGISIYINSKSKWQVRK